MFITLLSKFEFVFRDFINYKLQQLAMEVPTLPNSIIFKIMKKAKTQQLSELLEEHLKIKIQTKHLILGAFSSGGWWEAHKESITHNVKIPATMLGYPDDIGCLSFAPKMEEVEEEAEKKGYFQLSKTEDPEESLSFMEDCGELTMDEEEYERRDSIIEDTWGLKNLVN